MSLGAASGDQRKKRILQILDFEVNTVCELVWTFGLVSAARHAAEGLVQGRAQNVGGAHFLNYFRGSANTFSSLMGAGIAVVNEGNLELTVQCVGCPGLPFSPKWEGV